MTARVLIVDDVEFNLKLLETMLKRDYYQVFSANNGAEAISMARQVKPDIILMDAMMPEMNGFEAISIIKSDPELSFIPIIMVTALNAQSDKVRGLEAGADDFLMKPINEQALMTRLKSLIRLKVMDDELRLREQTSMELGLFKGERDERKSMDGALVLVLDDDALQYKKIADTLQEHGVVCVQRDSIGDLLSGTSKPDYSLIIVSTQLLKEDGLRFCSLLRSSDNYRNTPLLVVIEEGDDRTLTMALDLGVNDYLVSPIDTNELMARCMTQIKRKKYQDRLKSNYLSTLQQSIKDSLTGLYNRRYLETHIRNLLENPQCKPGTIALMMIDIDHFKGINDTYGHQSGDAVLVELAQRFSKTLRITDLCARYGGEEFVVVLALVNDAIATFIAERVRGSVEEEEFTIPVLPGKVRCTISIGLTILQEGDTLDSMIARADKNLYLAKQSGRNKVVSGQ